MVCPNPDTPTIVGKVPSAVESNLVPKGFGYIVPSIQLVLASVPMYQIGSCRFHHNYKLHIDYCMLMK